MFLQTFLKGASLAFYIVVPIGALSILYIKRTLQKGFLSGFFSSLGVTTGECIYASAAIYGVSFVSDFLLKWKVHLQFFGVLLMIYIGVKAIRSNAKYKEIDKKSFSESLFANYFSMLILTIFNPLTIFGFVAVFASFGAHDFQGNISNQLSMLLGFFSMSFFYCMLLIFIASKMRRRLNSDVSGDLELIKFLNKTSGVVIIIFTLLSLVISLTTR